MTERMLSTASVANKKPIADILYQCRRSFYFAFLLTLLIDTLSITPMVYMMSMYDRVIGERSEITLLSLTAVIIAMYIFWSSLEWIRSRLMVRLSLRIDWEMAAKVFDASFRRHVGRKNVNVQQLFGDMVALRNFLTGQPVLALMDAPFALVFIVIGGLIHPYLAVFTAVASILMLHKKYHAQFLKMPMMRMQKPGALQMRVFVAGRPRLR